MRKLALPIALVFGFAMIGCSDDDSCVDVDGDGYGEGSGCLGPDCDEGDETIWMSMEGYGDVDDDGENAITITTDLCSDGTLPAGYSDTAGTDCDDTNASAVMIVQGYLDADADGYGTGDVMDVCGDTNYLPPGYADNGDDCDDASAMIFMEWTGYADYDQDGVHTDVATTLCGTSVMPAGYGDTAGTDCDDIDMFATNDASHSAACDIKGTCIDTEASLGFPDMMGIGACASVDCDGQDPTCAVPMVDTAITCVDATSNCNTGELCWDPAGGVATTCWQIPACCENEPDPAIGLTCSEILTCLSDCGSLLPDVAAYGACQQFDCFENARPTSQHLYRIAAECAAAADCWAEQPGGAEAIEACVTSNCFAEFSPCMLD